MNIRLTLFEIFLMETIGCFCLWLLSEYVAALLTLIVGAIVSAVLVIALISEAIEKSKVPRRYFQIMAISILSALVAAGAYVWIQGGRFDFLGR